MDLRLFEVCRFLFRITTQNEWPNILNWLPWLCQINANTPYGPITWCLGESWGFISGILKLTIIQWRISSPATVDGRIIVPRSNILPTHHMLVKAKSEKSFSSSGFSCTYGWWLVIKERPRSYSSTSLNSDLLGMSHPRAPSDLILLRKGLQELYTLIFLERLLSIVKVSHTILSFRSSRERCHPSPS